MSSSISAKKTKAATETSPSSATEIGYNEDLLIQILLQLPAKSLIKFKVVSKQWMSLISGNKFCLAHTRSLHTKGPLKPSAVFLGDFHIPILGFRFFPITHDCVRLPSLNFTHAPNITLLQSCNGLLLCVSHDSGVQSHLICNPITRKFKMLSIPRRWNCSVVGVSLAFDPLKSPHHKIVSVWQRKSDKRKYDIGIHSSKTNSWSSSKISFTWNGVTKFDHGVFFKGAIYWDNISPKLELPYFDVENECLKTMPIPQVHHLPSLFRCLAESGGYLNLAVALGPPVNDFCIFEMIEDHSGWCLKHSINYDISSQKYFLGPFQVFCAIRSEEGDSILIVWEDGRAESINFKDRTIKELGKNYFCQLYDRSGGCQYFETLSLIL